jgi:tRNA (guanine37-N1)-methyltransferase
MAFGVDVITLVPEVWPVLLGSGSGLVGRAVECGDLVSLRVNDLRQYGKGVHKQVDDAPFGGGAGMVLAVGPLDEAIAVSRMRTRGPVLLLGPRGRTFTQKMAQDFAQGPGLTLVCGRYEGVDERVRAYVDEEVSVGDYVLSAGDPAAWVLLDAVLRLLPGVLGNAQSSVDESFADGVTLEYPQYTRPALYKGMPVPEVLRSGNHERVAQWRRAQQKKKGS